MRPIVSYDDISAPYEPPRPPPARKRKKTSAKKSNDESPRILTHEEIWDDSALIDAWNAASEEYQIHHGPDNEDWKKEPMHKSPLWYNTPAPTSIASASSSFPEDRTDEENGRDSKPLDFESFVPTHDPALDFESGLQPQYAEQDMMSTTGFPGMDEAFSRAQSAMYWAGYWTAMYHCRKSAMLGGADEQEDSGVGKGTEADEAESDDFVPTQR